MPRSRYSLADHPEARQRALWLIRDYSHLKARLDALDGFSSGQGDSGPHSSEPHSSTESVAIKRSAISAQLDIIDRAFSHVPPEYRRGLWESITAHKRYPDYAGIKTWKRWRQRLLWWVARDAGYID